MKYCTDLILVFLSEYEVIFHEAGASAIQFIGRI